MKKIGLINQRYGLEVNGGSEYYSRLIAERLKDRYDIEILTTTAIDNITWKNHYSAGVEDVGGVKVRRFPVAEKDLEAFHLLTQKIVGNPEKATRKQCWEWIEKQGPLSTELVEYVAANHGQYDAFIVVTYLYYPQIKSMPYIGSKAVFIPTAHEEPYLHFEVFKDMFRAAKAFVFLTEEERELVHSLFGVGHVRYDVLGVGVDVPGNVDAEAFRSRYSLNGDYIIYVGRIEQGKGCADLFDYFLRYKQRNRNGLKLVLMGNSAMEVPDHPDIVNLGFVSEEDKFAGIAGALALVQPSYFESLSIVLLEAMALSVPVLVNAKCEVLRRHCIRSNAGLYYENAEEFEAALNYLLWYEDTYNQMRENARKYVQKYYQWDTILARFEKMIDYVCGGEK